MSKRKCTFNSQCLEDPNFSLWFQKGEHATQAKCSLCQHSFDISNMGKSSLTSHAEGKGLREKGREKVKGRSSISTVFFKNASTPVADVSSQMLTNTTNTGISASSSSAPTSVIPKSQSTITSILKKEDVTKAKILCVLDII